MSTFTTPPSFGTPSGPDSSGAANAPRQENPPTYGTPAETPAPPPTYPAYGAPAAGQTTGTSSASESGTPETPTSPQTPPPGGWSAWENPRPYSGTTGTTSANGAPPYYVPPFDMGYNVPPSPRRRRILPLLLLALVLLIAVAGIGAWIGIATHSSSAPSVTIGATSAPVTVSSSSGAAALQSDVESVVKAVQPSVVEITSTGGSQEAIGSGDILTSDGYIVTNDHVVQGFNTFKVTLSNGSTQSARIVGTDPQDDLAVLKINATGLKPIAIADSSKVQVGEFSIALGNPLGLTQSATFGIVSALNRSASEGQNGPAQELTGLIQTSAPINPGNSGGALVDLSGSLVGIPTLGVVDPNTGAAASGIGYAIPSSRVSYVTQQLIAHGQLTSTGQGFLGIQGEDVTPQIAAANNLNVQSGVLIGGFANDAAGASPAQQAGIQTGDVITAINGQAVSDSNSLASALQNRAPGSQVTVTFTRGSQQHTVTVTLGERPTNAQG